MAELRFSALREVFNRGSVDFEKPSKVISEYYGKDVFDLHKMEHYLSKEAFKIAVNRHFNENKIEKYTEFYVVTNDLPYGDFERSYGFQSVTGKDPRSTTLKTIFLTQ